MMCATKETPEIMSCTPRLRLGFVGARTLNDGDEAWLKERFKEIWECSHKAVPNYHLRLTSGLAHGADRIAVNSFFDWRGNNAHELLAIHPCDPEQFRESSGIQDKEKFDAQRKAILADHRDAELVLDGSLPRGATRDTTEEAREKCMSGLARLLIKEMPKPKLRYVISIIEARQKRSRTYRAGSTNSTNS